MERLTSADTKKWGKWRPRCDKCGRIFGKGGVYLTFYDGWTGGYELEESLCPKCAGGKQKCP